MVCLLGLFGCCLFLVYVAPVKSDNSMTETNDDMMDGEEFNMTEIIEMETDTSMGSGTTEEGIPPMNDTTSGLANTSSTSPAVPFTNASTDSISTTTTETPLSTTGNLTTSSVNSSTETTTPPSEAPSTTRTSESPSTTPPPTSGISTDNSLNSDISTTTVSTASKLLTTDMSPPNSPLVGIIVGCVMIIAILVLLALAVFITYCCYARKKNMAVKVKMSEDVYEEVSLPEVSDMEEAIDTDVCPAYSTSEFIKKSSPDYVDIVVYDEVK